VNTYTYEEALKASSAYFNGDELAAKVFLDKYALRDNEQRLLEKTPTDMHRRISKEFARIEKNKFKTPLTEDEIFGYLDKFNKIVPQGSPMYGIGNIYQTVSLSNCYVVEPPLDSYGSILKTDEELAQISKRRGGNGTDIAHIRPAGAPTKNAARTSTGTIPFCSRFSNTIREVGQSGRRGALMLTQSIHHPESVIPWDDKVDGQPYDIEINGHKISSRFFNPAKLDFATMKYDTSKVTGANVSLRFTDEFLEAVEAGEKYQQRWPVDNKKNPKIEKMVDAREVWSKVVHSAWFCAEPGILFWDNILKESIPDCYAKFGFATKSTNPCGEIVLSANDSCRLLLLNLFGFVKNPFTKDAYFDYNEFYKCAQIAQRLMDDLIDLEEECINRILKKIESDPEPEEIRVREKELWTKILKACQDGRRTGTGITALGDTLAALNISYGSEVGIATTESFYKTLKFGAYKSSVDMAKELGAFPVWDHSLEKNNPFLNRIKDEFILINEPGQADCGIKILGSEIWSEMKKHGRRNIALLTTAPAGTVSIQTQTSSGIEPQFMVHPYIRRKKGNPGDKNFRSDFVDQNGDHWQEFKVYPPKVKMWMEITGNENIEESPWFNNTAGELDWKNRVRLQAAAQKHVDHSISSTLNLPHDVDVDKVDEIYRTAWKAGCKGVTIYRDGCRTGVLVKESTPKIDPAQIQKTIAPTRPKVLDCDVHHIKVKGEEYFVLVGKLPNSGDPYEVFAGKNGMISKDVKKGLLTKESRGKYHASFDDGTELKDVVDLISDEEEAITRLLSTSLRHGADIHFVVHQLEKVKGDMSQFSKAVSRALKKYIKDGTEIKGENCPECSSGLIRSEGCAKCPACSWSRCS
jgi:ribonucleoside-diphosphate reductase alpha chain